MCTLGFNAALNRSRGDWILPALPVHRPHAPSPPSALATLFPFVSEEAFWLVAQVTSCLGAKEGGAIPSQIQVQLYGFHYKSTHPDSISSSPLPFPPNSQSLLMPLRQLAYICRLANPLQPLSFKLHFPRFIISLLSYHPLSLGRFASRSFVSGARGLLFLELPIFLILSPRRPAQDPRKQRKHCECVFQFGRLPETSPFPPSPPSLSVSLSACLPVCLSVCLSVCLPLFHTHSIRPHIPLPRLFLRASAPFC
jgi:hypothetical protein